MRGTGQFLVVLLSLGVAAYAVVGYGSAPIGTLVHPDMKEGFTAHPLVVYVHVFAAATALLLGPFQFSARLRNRRIGLHRWMGRIYLGAGVLVGGLSGLYLSMSAFGGPVARLGFGALALGWLYTGLRACLAIRRGDVPQHRKWMVANFSLSFAAVMLRLYVPLAVVAGVEFVLAYRVVAWLCWLPNLALAAWLNARTPRRNGSGDIAATAG